jgi:antitoxin component YwqK of YwqJK toxin-antitoxin module
MLNKKIIILVVLFISSTLAFSQTDTQLKVVTTTYANGQLKTLSTFSDTIKNGVQLKLDTYGRLEKQEQYLFGVLDGRQLTFERGRVSVIKNYSKGLLNGKVERYSTSRRLSSSENYVKGVKSGESKWFYYSGKLCATYNYNNGTIVGESKFYHENGKVKSIYNFRNNEIDGPYVEFDENEHKILEGQYSKGLKEGKWKYFDASGKLIKTEKYKKGVKK